MTDPVDSTMQSNRTQKGKRQTVNEIMKCPKCGNEMEKGTVILSSGVRWKSEDSRFWQIGDILFHGNLWAYVRREAYRCDVCRCVALPY